MYTINLYKKIVRRKSSLQTILLGVVAPVQSLRSFKLAVSLGGVDSLVEHPASMSHGPFCMNDQDRQAANIDPALIRLRYERERKVKLAHTRLRSVGFRS